mmetsp:Transcript_23246/g.38531  ORF Transcript_23246/g.38531 Transcript_23246/m.38531 type:complete len:515 (-) Transcript_23246:70-1614(-)
MIIPMRSLAILVLASFSVSVSAESAVSSNNVATKKRLTEETMSQKLRKMEYAVRGKVVIAADRINQELAEGKSDRPFDHIVYTNIGNPHSVGQAPLTWPRQVLALTDLPAEVGIDHPSATTLFPQDAIDRARLIKEGLNGVGTGAYSHSQGAMMFRKDIAAFIQERDGLEANPDDIFMTNGASSGIAMVLQCLIANENCGVMIPIPQYPIYSATMDLNGGHKVGYFLNEESNWDLNMAELERSYKEASDNGVEVRGLVLINPGNPTGQVLSESAVQDIVRFCAKHNLVLLADEVYQENIYDEDAKFTSCKKAAHDAGVTDQMELASFHSTSKGLYGECGRRGGYMELVGFDEQVKGHIYKLASSSLCSVISGQVMTSLMCRGPQPGDASYESHEAEKAAIFGSLQRRAKLVSAGLDGIPGFSCQPSQGAMYCFPKVDMPPGAIKAAIELGTTPDALYAVSLLEGTGICVVPASGFGQKEGRYGFRTTFLPSEAEMARCVEEIRKHYNTFLEQYA